MSSTRRGLEAFLSVHADFRHDEVAAVTRKLPATTGSLGCAGGERIEGEVMVSYPPSRERNAECKVVFILRSRSG